MRVGNLSNRLTLFTEQGAIDVEQSSGGLFGADPQAVYDRWDEFIGWVASPRSVTKAVPYATENLGPPAPRPRQVFAIGANYRAHLEEADFPAPQWPMIFTKWPSSFAGPFGEIAIPTDSVDWEAELVAIVGRRARNVTAERGWNYIAGLTVGQDVTERPIQVRGVMPQFSQSKSFPGFSPSGPWLVTLDEFTDPGDLEISCILNDRVMQKARTSDLIFTVPMIVAELSKTLTLEPGDVIFTGTPGGVGYNHKPPIYLAAGDKLVTTIERIGEMRHSIVSPRS